MADDERKPMANIPPFGLRMQPDLKARVEDAARANNRSLNAEIVATLEEKYPRALEFNHDEFMERWIEPILAVDWTEPEFERRIRRADQEAKKIHPAFGVWQRARGHRLEIAFGVRDKSLLPKEMRDFLNSYFVNQNKKAD